MATGTNAIATELEVKNITGSSVTVTTNKCCTKSRAITLGADSSYLTSYTTNQLIKYSDIVKAIELVSATWNPGTTYEVCGVFSITTALYDQYDDFYLLITATASYGDQSEVKETTVYMDKGNSATGYSMDVPSGYIGITSGHWSGDTTEPGSTISVIPSLTYTYPANEDGIPRLSLAISLYGVNASSGSGSGGGVLIRSIDGSVGADIFGYTNSWTDTETDLAYDGLGKVGGKLEESIYDVYSIVAYDSSATKTAVYDYVP